MIRAPPHPPHCDRHLPLKGKAFAAKVPCRFRRGGKLLYWNQMPHGGFLSGCFLCCYVLTIAPRAVLSAGMNRNKKIFGKFKRTRFCGMIIAIRQFRKARRPCRTGKVRRPAPWNKTQGHRVKNAWAQGRKHPGTCAGLQAPMRPRGLQEARRNGISPRAFCPPQGTQNGLWPCSLPPRPSPKTAPRNCTKKGGIHP